MAGSAEPATWSASARQPTASAINLESTRPDRLRAPQADLVGQPARPAPREEEREARQEEDRQRVKDYALDRLGDQVRPCAALDFPCAGPTLPACRRVGGHLQSTCRACGPTHPLQACCARGAAHHQPPTPASPHPAQAMLIVPTHGGRTQRRLYRSLSQGLPDDLTQKLASLLAAEFSKKGEGGQPGAAVCWRWVHAAGRCGRLRAACRWPPTTPCPAHPNGSPPTAPPTHTHAPVYATVYADGPTRVLRFSDDKNVSSLEAQDVVLDLAARLKQVCGRVHSRAARGHRSARRGARRQQAACGGASICALMLKPHAPRVLPRPQVETQLRQVNAQFARLNGMSGAHMLDLYGRTAVQAPAAPPPQPALARKASKRLPLSETTRALIRQAHSRLTQVGSLPGSQAASQPGSPQRLPERSGASGSQGPSRSPSLSLAQPGISRTSTVRFDVPPGGTATHGSLPVPDQQAAGSARGGSASAAAGVLHIPAERDADREERLLPYRRLVIRTGQEAPGSQLEAGAPDPLVVAATAVPQASPAAAPRSSSEIQPVEPSGPSGDAAVAGRLPQGPMRASASGRDWGHITPSSERGVVGAMQGAACLGRRDVAPCAAVFQAAQNPAHHPPTPTRPPLSCLQPTRRWALGAWRPLPPRPARRAARPLWAPPPPCGAARTCCGASTRAMQCCCWAVTSA